MGVTRKSKVAQLGKMSMAMEKKETPAMEKKEPKKQEKKEIAIGIEIPNKKKGK